MRVSDHNKIKHISVLQIIIGLDCPKPEILRSSRMKYFRVIISFEISYFLNSDLIFRWSLFSDPKVISTYRRKILFSSIYYRVIKYIKPLLTCILMFLMNRNQATLLIKIFISESCRKNASCHSIVKTSKKNMPVLLKFSNILSTVIE